MNTKEKKIYTIEFTAIILLWTFVVISPLLFMEDANEDLMAVYVMWAEFSVVGVALLVNRFILMPSLFFSKRYISYFASLAILLTLIGIFVLQFDGVNLILNLFGRSNIADSTHNIGSSIEAFRPPHGVPYNTPHGATPHGNIPHGAIPRAMPLIPPAIVVVMLSFIVIVFDMGVRIATEWVISEQKNSERERERILAQLQNLQSQVSPHFFMNTLNNIHALVDIEPQRAKQTIIELSDLMSYLLYDCSSKESVSLQKELEFIGNYINLMKLRFSKDVEVIFSCDSSPSSITIPPLLFLNFIENAFKYGVDNDQKSIIKITFTLDDKSIEMSALNSNHSTTKSGKRHGLGITNSRKRLDLIYGDTYTLNISNKDKIFFVNLKIPLL